MDSPNNDYDQQIEGENACRELAKVIDFMLKSQMLQTGSMDRGLYASFGQKHLKGRIWIVIFGLNDFNKV